MIDTLTPSLAESGEQADYAWLQATDYARVQATSHRDSRSPTDPPSRRIAIEPDDVKKGLGRLILTVVDLLRELLERQAMRRIEAGSLAESDIERLGTTFRQLSEQMEVVKSALGLEGEDLNLDLGPLGNLLGN